MLHVCVSVVVASPILASPLVSVIVYRFPHWLLPNQQISFSSSETHRTVYPPPPLHLIAMAMPSLSVPRLSDGREGLSADQRLVLTPCLSPLIESELTFTFRIRVHGGSVVVRRVRRGT